MRAFRSPAILHRMPGAIRRTSPDGRPRRRPAWFKTGLHPVLVPRHPSWRGRQALPRIGRDTRPPSPRRLTGAGRLRRLFVVCEACQSVTLLASLLNHAHF